MRKLYAALCTVVIVVYAAAAWRGWEFGATKSRKTDPSVRSAGGGRYYHSGYRGGK